jgi:nickel transport protein
MGRTWSEIGRAAGNLSALMLFLLCPAPAFAHTLNVFVQRIEGAAIHGRAYFPDDVPAQNSDVIAHDASGSELCRTTTDENGNFTLTAGKRVDHYLVAETSDGHSSRPYIVHATALPDSLPKDLPAGGGGSQVTSPAKGQAGVPVNSGGKKNEAAAVRDQAIEQLGNQLDMLRQQVYDSEQRLRFRDILGGIGFILGLAGVAFYMKARRQA